MASRGYICKAVLLGLTSVAICASRTASSQSTVSEIANRYSTATLFLAVEGKTSAGEDVTEKGTGFIISPEGYLVTAAHLFLDKARVRHANVQIRGSIGNSFNPDDPTGLILPLDLITLDTDVDAALLKVGIPPLSGEGYKYVHICRQVHLSNGDPIHTLGFPLGEELSVNSGRLSAKDGPQGLWKTDILVATGSSGGPVFDDAGRVIGMVKGGLEEAAGINYFLPANLMTDLLMKGSASFEECQPVAEDVARECESQLVTYDLDLRKEDHPSISADAREYKQTFYAEPEYRIEEVRWMAESQTNADPPEIEIVDNGAAIHVITRIRSGPFFDRWRGWVRGMIITKQKRIC